MAFRVVGVVTDGVTRFMMEEQLQSGLLGEHRDLDGVKPAQLPVTRGEENARGEIQRDAFGARQGEQAERDPQDCRRRATLLVVG